MKTDEPADQEEFDEYQPPKKQGRKNKAQASKLSKESHMTRRRPQPQTSEQEMRPQNIPQSSGSEPIVSQGFENEVTKVVIIIPYTQMQEAKFEHFANTIVLGTEIQFSIQKTNEYITILARLLMKSNKMQVDQQLKMPEPLSPHSNSDRQEMISVFDIRGKYVYMAGYEPENKNIKGNRKQLNSYLFVEIVKFKVRNPFSDLFIYFHLKIEEYLTEDFVGLVNQGNTCYMNSYLQALYHIPAFRNLVYQAEIQDENKFPATLQQLFYNLDNSQKAASPEALVKSFGWGKHEASIQQDAQQFSCLFFQALQHKLNNSAPKTGYKNRTIDNLFKGSLNHYIRCKNIGTVIDNTDFRNENYEEFIDLQVTIAPTLSEALDLYTSEVHLEGDNAYYTEEFGKQQAFKGNFLLTKGVKLSYLPPILMIQLKRFEYNFEQNKNVKILSGLEYDQVLDFGKWTTSGEKDIYELYAVLVHEGARAQSGHYFNYVKQGHQWYKFNDESVQIVTRQRAFNFNFGGFHETIDFDAKQMKATKKFLESKTTAYMLVYIKQSIKDQLMKDDEKLPEWIQKKNMHKLQMEQDKKNKKNYFHKVGFIDWETNLKRSICSDSGFLNDIILQYAKNTVQQIPKQVNLQQWLILQKIIDPKSDLGDQKKKKSKKAKSSDQEKQDQKQTGIYLYYASDRQILMSNKPVNKVIDLLKVSPDPILFKAPLQAKKDEYLAVVKRYKVDKKDGKIQTRFFYDKLITIKKDTNYEDLMQIFKNKLIKKSQVEGMGKSIQYGFYLENQNEGPINIQKETGAIPVQSPKFNQLLICIVEEINFQMTEEQKKLYFFPKYYEIRKNIITLNIAEEKGQSIFMKKDLPGNETLSNLRTIIFENLPEEKQAQYISPQNIVLKAKIKKGSKIYYEVFQPEWKFIKEITKIDDSIQFTFSALTVQSRLSNYMIEIQYRNINKDFSQPIVLIVAKDLSSQSLSKIIKTHSAILEMLRNDGIQENETQIVLMTKKKTFINDIVGNDGKVPGKGDLDVVLKRQKNAVVVVIQRIDLNMQTSPIIQMDEEQFDPVANILLYHMSNSGQKIGAPLYIRADRRMQLSELKEKILDLIKDQVFFWEGKFHACALEKVIIQLYGKDSKKVIELTDLATFQAIKLLKIQQKTNTDTIRKKSKDLKYVSTKQSVVDQAKESPLKIVNQQEDLKMNEQEIFDFDKKEQRIFEKNLSKNSQQNNLGEIKQKSIQENLKEQGEYKVQVLEISDDSMGKQEDKKKQDKEKGSEPIEDPQRTKIEGPETILGVFPRFKVLKIRVLHSYLTRPNHVMKIHVYD